MTASRKLWICAWPGLRQLWTEGSYAALTLAVSFAVLWNVLFLAEFVWTDWISSSARGAGWLALAGTWGSAALWSWRSVRREARWAARDKGGGLASGAIDPLVAAYDEYLQGKWYEAEKIVRQLIRRNRQDVEARLLLATLCRRTGRSDEALRRLDELTLFDSAAQWQTEVEYERKLIERRRTEDAATAQTTLNDEAPRDATDLTRAA